jgi:hypothetical protein
VATAIELSASTARVTAMLSPLSRACTVEPMLRRRSHPIDNLGCIARATRERGRVAHAAHDRRIVGTRFALLYSNDHTGLVMSRRPSPQTTAAHTLSLLDKARRLRARGELRKALVALREACLRDESDAALWTLYGALSARHGRDHDARRALRHALWLRKIDGDDARMGSTQALLDGLDLPTAA